MLHMNRELMDVIESLQRKSEEEEVEESGKEEANEAIEESTEPVGDTKIDAENSKVMEGNSEVLGEQSKALLKYKRKDSKGCLATLDGNAAKRSKIVEVEEENGSPSSPLFVKSDGDFE